VPIGTTIQVNEEVNFDNCIPFCCDQCKIFRKFCQEATPPVLTCYKEEETPIDDTPAASSASEQDWLYDDADQLRPNSARYLQ